MRCFKSSPLILAVGLTLSPSAAPSQDEGPPSIEELTRRYREKSEVALEAMRSEVEYLLSQLADHAQTERRTSMDEVREKLVALGPEIGPLIVNSLDPGAKPKRSAQSFSTQVAMILEELSLAPVTDHLIQMAGSGSLAGKRMAIRVLGHSEDSARVSPVLKELYTEGEAPPRATILASLARIGGDQNLNFVTELLASDEREEVDAALYALTVAKVTEAADHILAFSSDLRTAAAHVPELCKWYRACPLAVDKHHCASMLALAKSSRVNLDDRITLVSLLASHDRYWPSSAKKALESMADTGSSKLREAVLIALVLSGDRGAKRDLLSPYEDQIARNGRWTDAWIDLALIEYKIREYRDAIKHYEQAMKLGRIDTRRQRDVYLGLARCYALNKNYRNAQEWLQRAPISRKQLSDLAEDPDFLEMAAHSRYGKAFGTNED